MRFSSVTVKRRRLSLTSLIDVIFLLLLFFMLSSTFTRFSEVDIVAGRAGQQVSASRMPDVFIRLGKDNSWKVNGAELAREAAVTELLRLEQAGAKTAVIVVRDDVSSQALVDALELVARSSKLTVTVAG